MTHTAETKIALFLPSLLGGGAERAMLNLAHGLADHGCAVDLVLARATGPYMEDIRDTIRLVDLKSSRVLKSLPHLARYLRQERPHAMISALDYANVVALWARRLSGVSCRSLVNEQNTISQSAPNSARLRQRFVPHLVKHFYPWADFIVGNSQGVAADLIHVTGLSHERIKILYNPVVTPEVRQQAEAPLDHPWFADGEPPVILAVGRLTHQKDFPMLIGAFAQVQAKNRARLLILGEGPNRAELDALITHLGLHDNVAMPGFVDNPYAYMRQAALFALSSRWEGLPTVLIEALYCGLPIVATDCPSGPREILANGEQGLLVPVGDTSAMAKALETGLTGLSPRPTDASWRPYSLETVVGQYMELLANGHG